MVRPERSPELAALPSEWTDCRVDDIFKIQQGKQVSKKNRIGDNQRPFLRTKNVFWGQLILSELDQMHFTESEEQRLTLQDGDLLLCEGGWVGRTAVWRGEIERCYYQNHLHRLRVINDQADPMFALYWFWYAFDLGKVYFGRKNVTTIPNMSKSRLGGLPMPLPPLPEQRRISAVLSLVQRAIEEQERLIALTTELKKALMHKLFTEGTRGEPQKQTEIGPIPKTWEVVRFGDVIDVAQYGLSVRADDRGTYPILRMTNQVGGKIAPVNLKYVNLGYDDLAKFRVIPGDILFNRTNSFDLVGRTALFDLDGDYVFASYLIRLRMNRERLNPFFLNHYFNCDTTQARLKSIATRAVSQSNISATRLKGFEVPVPSLNEQAEIVANLDLLDVKRGHQQQLRASLQDLFRTLLHQLMTAEICVGDLDLSELDILEQGV